MNNILKIENVSKKYGKVQALTGAELSLGHGIYALLGPNGSGKSTLMNIIAGLLKPTSGTVYYNGTDIAELGVEYRKRLGYMPQYPAMYPSFTVMEFLLYMSELKGLPKGTEDEIERLLLKVELSDVRDRKISALSGGMKQRLSLCSAVLGDPEILILDEPTAGLDPKQRVAVRDFISEESGERIVIWATHIVSDIESISDEVIFMKRGAASVMPNVKDGRTVLDGYLEFFGDVL